MESASAVLTVLCYQSELEALVFLFSVSPPHLATPLGLTISGPYGFLNQELWQGCPPLQKKKSFLGEFMCSC